MTDASGKKEGEEGYDASTATMKGGYDQVTGEDISKATTAGSKTARDLASGVMTAASGVQMTGSPMTIAADTFFATQMDALNIQQASSREQAMKTDEAAMTRLEGRAKASGLKYQSYASLINSGSKAATLMG